MDRQSMITSVQNHANQKIQKFLEQVNNYPEKNPKTNCITYKNFKGILDYYGEVKDEINADGYSEDAADAVKLVQRLLNF